ncbi:MAG: Rrf2 family transcriptional regulator [Bacteroidales bacterium]|nr:Rrf2 family transcriptional regulator [Bacteroidales bacterium]
MKISYKCGYSLKVILDLSVHYPDKLLSIKELAVRQDIPKKFLEQILLDLKKGGFVDSRKGPKGGYFLVRTPGDILLGDVIRHIEGTVYPIPCIDPDKPTKCDERISRFFIPIWLDIGNTITKIIDSINFEDLKQRHLESLKKFVSDYQI